MVYEYGSIYHMQTHTDLQKITVNLPKKDLLAAQAVTGKGITETLRQALESLARRKVYDDLLSLRGTYKPGITYEEMKYDVDDIRY